MIVSTNSSLLDVVADFPILAQKVYGKRLAYLDSAASAQKPQAVLNAISHFYTHDYANIHRGAHILSQRATEIYESVRGIVRGFINAKFDDEIVFTRGATESINLVAASWGGSHLKKGDEVILTQLEHHANIVPWQFLRTTHGIVLKIVPIQPSGEVLIEDIKAAFSSRTRLVSLAHVSNALGTILPIHEITTYAHQQGVPVLVDGCQAIMHMPVDVQALGADFYAFSGHKLYGPTGVGVLYGRYELLESMPPWQGGGDMIESVTFEETLFREPPYRFEAGTPPIAQVVGLSAAIQYIQSIGMDRVAAHEAFLLRAATEQLETISGVHLVGTAPHKAGIVSFVMDDAHPHDIGTILDQQGVAIRTGHHCAQPVMDALGLPATARASFGIYNTLEDIEALVFGVRKVQEIFG